MLKQIQIASAVLVAACAAHPDPIIDTKGVNVEQYQLDLEECEAFKEPVKTEVGAAKGAVAGAAVGGATGAITGDIGEGAGVGAIAGAARSAQLSEREKQQVVKNCLRGRGYKVLN
jgi:outer membrane lipoprotein SlyB